MKPDKVENIVYMSQFVRNNIEGIQICLLKTNKFFHEVVDEAVYSLHGNVRGIVTSYNHDVFNITLTKKPWSVINSSNPDDNSRDIEVKIVFISQEKAIHLLKNNPNIICDFKDSLLIN